MTCRISFIRRSFLWEWLDSHKRPTRSGSIPVSPQLHGVDPRPMTHTPERVQGQATLQEFAGKRDRSFHFAMCGMEVGRRMVVVVHGDVHPMEPRDARHALGDERA